MESEQSTTNMPFNPFGASNGLLSNDINQNVKTSNQESSANFKGFIELKIKNRNKKKFITYVEGLNETGLDLEKLVTKWRKTYCCSVANDNGVIKLSGDKRDDVVDYLVKENVVKEDQIKVHGH
jgi:translation initiation factor SUI1